MRPLKPMTPQKVLKMDYEAPSDNLDDERRVFGSADFTIFIDTVISVPRDYKEVELIFVL